MLHRLVVLGMLCLLWPTAPSAQTIEVNRAQLEYADGGWNLTADFDFDLPSNLEEAVNKGIALYFLVEFELIRPRWYWLNEKLANARQQYRLSYNALTRQYRVGVGKLYQNFGDLSEALSFMSRVRLRELVEPGALNKGATYTAALRMRLDSSQLPRPFQVSAVGSREWSISSDWHRWMVSP